MFRKKSAQEKPEESRHVWTELDALMYRVNKLAAAVESLQTEWGDTKDQLRRSYQRMEKAAQRLQERETPPGEGSYEAPRLEGRTDGYSRTLERIRQQRGG